jgi:hypothetical protein
MGYCCLFAFTRVSYDIYEKLGYTGSIASSGTVCISRSSKCHLSVDEVRSGLLKELEVEVDLQDDSKALV